MKKKNFVLRLDEEMYQALNRWATDEFRSVNGQLEWIINKALADAKRLPSKKAAKSDKNKPTE